MTKVTLMPRPTLVHDTGARALSLADLAEREGTPAIRDTDLGGRLGVRNPAATIRKLIVRNLAELRAYGVVSTAEITSSAAGGRPGREYWLNEGQALVICALSRTPKATAIRKQIIDVFMAYRAGRLSPTPAVPIAPAEPATVGELAVQLALISARIDMLGAFTSRVGEALVPNMRGVFHEMLTAADNGAAATAAATLAKLADRPAVEADARIERVERTAEASHRAAPVAKGKRGKAQPTSGPDLLYGMPSIAEYLQLGKGQAYHLAEKGGLPTFRLGRIICATRASIDQWVAASAQGRAVRS